MKEHQLRETLTEIQRLLSEAQRVLNLEGPLWVQELDEARRMLNDLLGWGLRELDIDD